MSDKVTNAVNVRQSPSGSPSVARGHFNYLDSFRGLAALWVLLSHVWEAEIGYKTHSGLHGFLTNWILCAHFAVDVFIVLSGFCLMLPVARSGSLEGGAHKFYGRRVRRILPPYYLCLGISTFIYFAALKVGRVHHASLSAKMLLSNVLLLQDLFPQYNRVNPSLWSVAAECKIYLLFPVIIWLYYRYSAYAVLAFAAAVGYGLTAGLNAVDPYVILSLACPWYVLLFAIGVCAGAVVSSNTLSTKIKGWRIHFYLWGLLLVIALNVYPISNADGKNLLFQYLPLVDVIVGAFAASAMVLLHHQYILHRRGPLLDFLSWSPLVQTGRYAYSIYLMHGPCLVIITAVVKRFVSSGMPENIGKGCVFFIGIPLTLAGCYLFYLKCELPFAIRKRA